MKTAAETPQALLRTLPAVEKLLTAPALSPLLRRYNRSYVTDTVRAVLTTVRQEILAGALRAPVEEAEVVRRVAAVIAREDHSPLRSVVNATGTVLHTNLGRALLAKAAIDEVVRAAATPVTLEYDLIEGGRGDRDEVIEADRLALTGAEGATVVNNNAAAVLLALNTLADGKEAVVSRGELIEIGGSSPPGLGFCSRSTPATTVS